MINIRDDEDRDSVGLVCEPLSMTSNPSIWNNNEVTASVRAEAELAGKTHFESFFHLQWANLARV